MVYVPIAGSESHLYMCVICIHTFMHESSEKKTEMFFAWAICISLKTMLACLYSAVRPKRPSHTANACVCVYLPTFLQITTSDDYISSNITKWYGFVWMYHYDHYYVCLVSFISLSLFVLSVRPSFIAYEYEYMHMIYILTYGSVESVHINAISFAAIIVDRRMMEFRQRAPARNDHCYNISLPTEQTHTETVWIHFRFAELCATFFFLFSLRWSIHPHLQMVYVQTIQLCAHRDDYC